MWIDKLAAAILGALGFRGNRGSKHPAPEQDSQFHTLANSIPQLCWMANADGHIFWYNQRWYEYTGATPESMEGWGWQSVHDPEMLQAVLEKWKSSIAGATPFEMVFPLRGADGVFRPFLTRVVPVRDDTGNLERWFGTNTDITEQRNIEQSLRENEERLRLAQQVARVGTFDWNIRTGMNRWTPELEAMYGLPTGGFALTEPAWEQLLHPEDRARGAELIRRSLATGHFEGEWRVIWPDKSLHWIYGRASVIKDDRGEPLQMIGVNIDITERKLSEEALRESETRYSTLAEALPAIVFTSSSKGETEYVNSRWEEYTGLTFEQSLKAGFASLIHPDDRQRAEEQWASAIRDQTVLDTEFRLRRADGVYRWFRCRAKPLFNTEGHIYKWLGISSDTDDEKRAEERLRQSQKMEAVGRLAGGVAHDFNNLLTAIMGYNSMLMERLEAFPDAVAQAREVQGAAERASALTRQLLTFSRRDMSQPKLLSLNDSALNIRNLLKRVIGEDIEIAMKLAPDLWRIRADPGHIDQVIMNLAVNARDAMPEGGFLSFQTANRLVSAGSADARHASPGEYVTLEVKDTGSGMDGDTRSRLFEPFFTTKEQGKGTGLGLSIVYGVVEQNGGFITVESAPGEGATFRLSFPRSAETVEKMGPALASGPVAEVAAAATVLVVEDDPAVRSFVVAVLGKFGYRIHEAATPADALALLESGLEQVELLLTDVLLPGMRGPELSNRVRQLIPGIAVLYMSGYSDSTFLKAGALADGRFLQKPFTADTLARAVHETLELHLTKRPIR